MNMVICIPIKEPWRRVRLWAMAGVYLLMRIGRVWRWLWGCLSVKRARKDSNTKLQIFDIDHVIHELSQGMTLKAGTIIATGTPAGVGMGMDPPQFLRPGDTVQCEIEGIGTLTNTVR